MGGNKKKNWKNFLWNRCFFLIMGKVGHDEQYEEVGVKRARKNYFFLSKMVF